MGPGGMDALVRLGGGDMRKTLNILQVVTGAMQRSLKLPLFTLCKAFHCIAFVSVQGAASSVDHSKDVLSSSSRRVI